MRDFTLKIACVAFVAAMIFLAGSHVEPGTADIGHTAFAGIEAVVSAALGGVAYQLLVL
jgi:hypothetical protein